MAYPGSTFQEEAEDAISYVSDIPDRPVMWKVPKKDTPMYKHQNNLPRLPIPSLDQTCVKYIKSVRPLLTDEEFAKTQENVTNFLLDGTGDELQKRLMAITEELLATGFTSEQAERALVALRGHS